MAADGVRPAEFGELLTEARFVSLHARQPASGPDLFGEPEFARMRHGSFFINTARETLVDEEALLAALSSGHLAGAALDVLRPRAAGEVNPLLGLANVVATPHIGGATFETLDRGAAMVAEEIERFAAGSALVNVINPNVLVG
jgi:D-3-phosphoglycerate dehydrogenase